MRAALMASVPTASLFGFAGMDSPAPAEAVSIFAPLVTPAPENALPNPLPDRAPEAPAKAVEASYYGKGLEGRPTANGERFDPSALTAAHRTLPFGTILKVTNAATGKSVNVRINDRGPFHGNREIDLSTGAAKALGMLSSGTANVILDLVKHG